MTIFITLLLIITAVFVLTICVFRPDILESCSSSFAECDNNGCIVTDPMLLYGAPLILLLCALANEYIRCNLLNDCITCEDDDE